MKKNVNDIDNLILEFLENSISKENLKQLRNWLKESPENEAYFKQLENSWLMSCAPINKSKYHKNQAYQQFQERVAQQKKIKKQHSTIRQIFYKAACIALFIGFGASMMAIFNSIKSPKIMNYTVETPRRAKLKVDLPDGSIVWLNAESRLSYNNQFGITNRDLRLEGEGYFEINKNTNLQLTVISGSTAVSVFGTKFNISNYTDDDFMNVSLLEGSIGFKDLRYGENIILKPSEIIICNKHNGAIAIKEIESQYMNAWINNDVFFNEEKLGNIVRVLERAFDVKFCFSNNKLKDLVFYGNITIGADNIDQIMSMMASTKKFRYNYNTDEKKIVIF